MSSRSSLGPRPDDPARFAAERWAVLREASVDLGHLLGRGYAEDATLKLVGDRYQLHGRQRTAVRRSTCSPEVAQARAARRLALNHARGHTVKIDGYNLLITLAAARAGGVLLRGRDGALRDLAGLHGGYRPDDATSELAAAVGQCLHHAGVSEVIWYLDAPISKSGQLRGQLAAIGRDHGWTWQAHTVPDPDALLEVSTDPVVSSDARILDHAACWIDLAGALVSEVAPNAWVVDWWASPEAQP